MTCHRFYYALIRVSWSNYLNIGILRLVKFNLLYHAKISLNDYLT